MYFNLTFGSTVCHVGYKIKDLFRDKTSWKNLGKQVSKRELEDQRRVSKQFSRRTGRTRQSLQRTPGSQAGPAAGMGRVGEAERRLLLPYLVLVLGWLLISRLAVGRKS